MKKKRILNLVLLATFITLLSVVLYILIGVIGALAFVFFAALLIYSLSRRKKQKNHYLKPNWFYYQLVYLFLKISCMFRGAKVKLDKGDVKDKKGPFIILGNHGGFWDFYYMSKAFYPRRVTVVMNRYYDYSPILSKIIKPLYPIRKKLFSNDIETIKNMMQAAKSGNIIALFPEGRLSTSGTNFNIADGTEKLIKKLNIDVVDLHILGSYKTCPKWATYKRKGLVEVTTKTMITKEELQNLSLPEIKKIIIDHISYNEFDNKGVYKSKDMTAGLDGILYLCPKCGSVHELVFENSQGYCKKCGFTVSLNNEYKFESNDECPKNIYEWYELQNDFLRRKIYDENYEITAEVTVSIPKGLGKGMMNVGEGVASINKEEFKYIGTINEKEVEYIIPLSSLKGLPYSSNEEFELYYDNVLHYFYPKYDKWKCLVWSQFVDVVNKK